MSIDDLFLHCPFTTGLWHKLFRLAGLQWVPLKSIGDMFISASRGFGNSAKGSLIWFIWQERNAMIFENRVRLEEAVWDSFYFYSSLWASCTSIFRGVPFAVLQLNWLASCVLVLAN